MKTLMAKKVLNILSMRRRNALAFNFHKDNEENDKDICQNILIKLVLKSSRLANVEFVLCSIESEENNIVEIFELIKSKNNFFLMKDKLRSIDFSKFYKVKIRLINYTEKTWPFGKLNITDKKTKNKYYMKTKNVDIQWYENFDYIREFPLYNLAGPPSQVISYEVCINASTEQNFEQFIVFIDIFNKAGRSTGRRLLPKCYFKDKGYDKWIIEAVDLNVVEFIVMTVKRSNNTDINELLIVSFNSIKIVSTDKNNSYVFCDKYVTVK